MSGAPQLHIPPTFSRGIAKITGNQPLLQLPGVYPVGSATVSQAQNSIVYMPIEVRTRIIIDQLTWEATAAMATAGNRRVGIVAANEWMQPTGNVVYDAEVAMGAGVTGIFSTPVTNIELGPGRWLLLSNCDTSFTARSVTGAMPNLGIVNTLSGNPLVTQWTRTGGTPYGAFTTPVPEWTATVAQATGMRYTLFPRVIWQAPV